MPRLDPQHVHAVRKDKIAEVLREFFAKGGQPKCPAAQMGFFADSGNRYIRCGIEEKTRPGKGVLPVDREPLSVMLWCCDDYTGCPMWKAVVENDPAMKRVRRAFEAAKIEAQTERQIAAGIRVDDRGQEEQEQAVVATHRVRELHESVREVAADALRKSVERHWSTSNRVRAN